MLFIPVKHSVLVQWSIQSQKLEWFLGLPTPSLELSHSYRATTAVPIVAEVAPGSGFQEEIFSFRASVNTQKTAKLSSHSQCLSLWLLLPRPAGLLVSLASVTPELFRTAPGCVLGPSDPVEVGSLQNVPGAGSRWGMSAALPPPALTDWHFWFGAEPGEWTEGFESWEIFCLRDLEDSYAKKETLPCRNAESQPVFLLTDCLPRLCFTELHPASMTNDKSSRLKNLCGLHPAALSFSHGPRGFLAFVKSPSVLENELPVAGDFRFCNWTSWLANIYWVLMIRPAPFYADYMRDRGEYSFPMFSTLLILTTWLWSKISPLFFPSSRWAMPTIPVSVCCVCQGDSCHKVTGLLYLMSVF